MTVPSVIGKTCPYCQTPIKPASEVVVCRTCGMPHHQECWMENGRCTTFGCSGTPQLVSSSTVDLTATVQPMGVTATPPTQPVGASIPPPPQMAMTYAPMQAPVAQDMYLEGNEILVIRDGCMLPDLCIITGKTGNLARRQRSETWAPSWTAIFYLFGILIGAVIRIAMQKTGRVCYAIEKECASQKLKLLLLNWGLFLVLFGGMFASFAASSSNESFAVLGLFLMLACIIAPTIIYYVEIKFYSLMKIENGYIWIKFRKPEITQALYAAYLNQRQGKAPVGL